MTRRNGKKILKYVLSLSLAAVLLWIPFREVEWNSFIEELARCRWEYILLSMLAGAFAFWLRALRWRMLLVPIDADITRLTTFNGVNIGNISNFILPRVGEFVRCGVVSRRSRISYDRALGTVVLERGWELLVMVMMLAVVIIGGYDRFGGFFMEQVWTPMTEKFSFSLWWVVAAAVLAAVASVWILWRYRRTSRFCEKVWNIVTGLFQGFASCLKMQHKWLFFVYTAMIWMTYWFMAASVVWAAPFLDHLTLIDALFLSLVGGLGFAVPVPGGVGAFHFIISLALFGVYDVPVETGIIYATLSHTSQAVTQILFGAGSYLYETLRS